MSKWFFLLFFFEEATFVTKTRFRLIVSATQCAFIRKLYNPCAVLSIVTMNTTKVYKNGTCNSLPPFLYGFLIVRVTVVLGIKERLVYIGRSHHLAGICLRVSSVFCGRGKKGGEKKSRDNRKEK